MNVQLISFSERGEALARRLAERLGGEVMRCGQPESLQVWTERRFHTAEGLIFVGAAGIAVRAIAPYVTSKAQDPAVVVVDETGMFAISLLSGHLGGANELAQRVAELCGATPVITTATDRNGVFAVDNWARMQDCTVRNPHEIRRISARLLAGETIKIRSDWPIAGEIPKGIQLTQGQDCDVLVSIHTAKQDALQLVPRIAVLGVGCKKGTSQVAIEAAFREICARDSLTEEAFAMVCSVDRKAGEPGLLAFCQAHGLSLQTYTAEQLQTAVGDFSSSAFVQQIIGVDNVCERSAVLGSGGTLYRKKQAGNGVTMAVALRPFDPDWRWRYE